MRIRWQTGFAILVASALPGPIPAQTALTWQQVKARFQSANPSLHAGQIAIQESKSQEVTANLRPNPDFSFGVDQLTIFPGTPYRPLSAVLPSVALSYLHERAHKRELRLESARQATGIAESQQVDLERSLLFNLRTAFVATLQAKALLALAKENLEYFDREMAINRERFRAGDIAQLDLNRLVLQRIQYESDFETAQVNMRTAKITLLTLLNDRTPVDKFDVAGPFDFSESLQPLDDIHTEALEARPDLHAARQAVVKAVTDHKLAVANGSTDPTFGADMILQHPFSIGVSVDIPLRLFDRNQGEKERTQLDIRRAEKQRDLAEAQVFNDVDSAYYTVLSTMNLLKPYKETYLKTATSVRDTMAYAYQHGQAALVDYLDSQRDYRATQVTYLTLVGSHMTAAAQLNLAVGREVMP